MSKNLFMSVVTVIATTVASGMACGQEAVVPAGPVAIDSTASPSTEAMQAELRAMIKDLSDQPAAGGLDREEVLERVRTIIERLNQRADANPPAVAIATPEGESQTAALTPANGPAEAHVNTVAQKPSVDPAAQPEAPPAIAPAEETEVRDVAGNNLTIGERIARLEKDLESMHERVNWLYTLFGIEGR